MFVRVSKGDFILGKEEKLEIQFSTNEEDFISLLEQVVTWAKENEDQVCSLIISKEFFPDLEISVDSGRARAFKIFKRAMRDVEVSDYAEEKIG